MNISDRLDNLHKTARQNIWLWLFSIFCRFSLAFGFFVAGMVKIIGERFASGLHAKHPMGYFLEALHFSTGYYYTFIGIAQILAAIFLIIPRTVTLGAFIYFPIILNIWILTYATRFDGSMFTAPLMTLANLYLLGWHYEKWKYILPFNDIAKRNSIENEIRQKYFPANGVGFFPNPIRFFYTRIRGVLSQLFTKKFPFLVNFPWLFVAGVLMTMIFFVGIAPRLFNVVPRNTFERCVRQFKNTNRIVAGENFCGCIHEQGEPLNKCLNDYENAPDDSNKTQ